MQLSFAMFHWAYYSRVIATIFNLIEHSPFKEVKI